MGKTFLVVDDSPAMRQLVSLALKGTGNSVITAENGREALAKASGTQIDMVITDLNMPEMDGIAFIRQLRSMPEFKFVPIVMLTTETQEAKRQEGRAAGASGWLVKPFTTEKLRGVVRKFVN